MESSGKCISAAEADGLREEIAGLKRTLARMSEASIKISGNLGTEAVLQEVVNSA